MATMDNHLTITVNRHTLRQRNQRGYSTATNPRAHKTLQLHQTPYTCPHCEIVYNDILLYSRHMHAHGNVDPFQCTCGHLCTGKKYEFNDHLYWNVHELKSGYPPEPPHLAEIPEGEDSNVAIDSVATSRHESVSIPPALADDREGTPSTSSENLTECSNCGIDFKDGVLFRRHMGAHVKGHPFICRCGVNCHGNKYEFNEHLYVSEHPVRGDN